MRLFSSILDKSTDQHVCTRQLFEWANKSDTYREKALLKSSENHKSGLLSNDPTGDRVHLLNEWRTCSLRFLAAKAEMNSSKGMSRSARLFGVQRRRRLCRGESLRVQRDSKDRLSGLLRRFCLFGGVSFTVSIGIHRYRSQRDIHDRDRGGIYRTCPLRGTTNSCCGGLFYTSHPFTIGYIRKIYSPVVVIVGGILSIEKRRQWVYILVTDGGQTDEYCLH